MKKKIKEILFIALLFLIPTITIVLNAPLTIDDEIWNFQNVMKLSRGLTIYEDCNIIVTPLFFYIGEIFLKIFGNHLLAFRLYNVGIFTLLFIMIFIIFRSLKMDTNKSFLSTCFLYVVITPFIECGANYNVLVTCLFLIGMYLFLRKRDMRGYSIFQGIILYLILFTKQNVGLYYGIAIIICESVFRKEKVIQHLACQMFIAMALSIINIIVLYIDGSLEGFINYAFLGMKSFINYNISISHMVRIVLLFEWTLAITSYVLYILLRKKKLLKEDDSFGIIFTFAIFLNLTVFPIVNLYHTCFAILLNMMMLMVLIDNLHVINLKTVPIGVLVGAYVFINLYGIFCGIKSIENIKIVDRNSPYFYTNMTKEMYNKMNEVIAYIQEKEEEGIDVILLSQDAALYMIPLEKNHKALDLAFAGNLGKEGEKTLLDRIIKMENVEILLNRTPYWQEIEEVRLYIIENLIREDNVNEYYVYRTKGN